MKLDLKKLPADVDVEAAATQVMELMDSPWGLGRWCQKLPPSVIREVLARKSDSAWHLFLRLAVDGDEEDATVARTWKRALEAVLHLQLSYAWGSKQRREKLAALARDPTILAAVQGTVAHANPVLDMLAVLVIDASPASLDALVGHFNRAVTDTDGKLDRITRLRTHARSTPALDALFADVATTIDKRAEASPALDLAPLIGLGEIDELWFNATISSRGLTRSGVSRIQAHVTVDSRHARWYAVSVTDVDANLDHRSTYFTDDTHPRDELGLGRCTPAELPHWLAISARTRKIEWAHIHVRSGLRGKKRDQIAAWLRGETKPLAPKPKPPKPEPRRQASPKTKPPRR